MANEYSLYVDYVPDLEWLFDRVSLVLGDAIHNLRSALDHLVFQLAVVHTGETVRHERRIQFPIVTSSTKFADEVGRRLAEVNPVHVRTIESFQPCSGHRWWAPHTYYSDQMGGEFHPLAMLRRLSNVDKHRYRLTMTLASAMGFQMSGLSSAAGYVFAAALSQDGVTPNQPVRLGMDIARARVMFTSGISPLEDTAYLLPEIALRDGRPLRWVLERLRGAVVRIVDTFEALPP